MQTEQPYVHDEVGGILLRTLAENQLIEEADVLSINVGAMLTEAKTADTYETQDGKHVVTWKEFTIIYTNYEKYPTVVDVMQAFGFPTQGVDKETPARTLRRIVKHFNVNGKTLGGRSIPSPKERHAFFSQEAKVKMERDPTMDDIDPGSNSRRSKSTVIMDRLNKQDILPGQFYANRTRIPPRRWASWLKFWDRRKHHVKPNKFKFVGRNWGKTFIMGYQIDRNLLVEIWYNSIDSTFSLHDRNGVELGTPVETVQEAVKYLTVQVAQMDKSDEEFFTLGANNQVAQSMMRTLSQGIQGDVGEAKRQDMLKRQQRRSDALDRLQDRKDRNNQAKWADRRGKVAKWTKEQIAQSADQTMRKVMMSGDAPVNYAEFRDQAIRAAKQSGDEVASYVKSNIRDLYKQWEDAVEAERERQRKKEADIDRSARDALDPNVHGDDSTDWADQMNRERKEKEEARRRKDQKEFAKRHGSNISKSLEKAAKSSFAGGQSSSEMDALEKARQELQNGIKDEPESDESTVSGKDGLGDYYGNILQRRKKDREMNESSEEDDRNVDAPSAADSGPGNAVDDLNTIAPPQVDHAKQDQQLPSMRKMAEKSPYTQAMLKGQLMGSFETYQATRIKDASMGGNRVTKWFNQKFLKGRKDRLELPTNRSTVWDALTMSLKGEYTRADFIIGFSLGGKVNIEIWYVSEPSVDRSKWHIPSGMVSSYYVYDVTAQKVIRKYLPYYRNAIQVAYAKIGTTI